MTDNLAIREDPLLDVFEVYEEPQIRSEGIIVMLGLESWRYSIT
jgi:hypothetical protein